jgi:hypothetical protein
MNDRESKFFSALGAKRFCSRFLRFYFVLVLAGGFATTPPLASGQFIVLGTGESVTLSNFTGFVFRTTLVPDDVDCGAPGNRTFATGLPLTGAPLTVTDFNSSQLGSLPCRRWWHWTAPADGVAEMNVGPIYVWDNSYLPAPLPGHRQTHAWLQMYTGADATNLTGVALLPFSQSAPVDWMHYSLFTFFGLGNPQFLPSDRALWAHKFRFPVAAGQTYHLALIAES